MVDSAHVYTDDDLLGPGDRSWGWALVFGMVSLVLGVVMGLRPRATIDGIAIVLGVFLLANGLFRIVTAASDSGGPGAVRALIALVGLASVAVGILFVRDTNQSVATLAIVIGLFWIVGGIIEAVSAYVHPGTPGSRFRIVMGVFGLVAGLVTVIVPSITLVTLAAIMGVWLAVCGVLQIATALMLRKLTSSRY